MSDARAATFVETVEHLRFVEFCEACRRDRYIGLCYGPPGVGKTFSARRHARRDAVSSYSRRRAAGGVSLNDALGDVAFYSVPVVNSAAGVLHEVAGLRTRLRDLVQADIRATEGDPDRRGPQGRAGRRAGRAPAWRPVVAQPSYG